MTEVPTIAEAYELAKNQLRLYKFGMTSCPNVAFVLATTRNEAEALIKAAMVDVDWPDLIYLGCKEMHELKPCIMLNQFPVF